MSRGRWIGLAAVVVAVLLVSAGVLAVSSPGGRSGRKGHAPPPLPPSMAAVGDSITQAFDVNSAGLLRDNPQESWSTGQDVQVDSHLTRISRVHPVIAGHGYNDAVSGSKMAALDGQLSRAASQRAAYVTVLMGANDLCTPTVTAMTATSVFGQQLRAALSHFFAADPGAHMLVASVPNLFGLWQTLHTNALAQLVWGAAHICQSMLAPSATDVQRQAVVAREQADNAALADMCGQFTNCRFDGGAVFATPLRAAEISKVDYFHPSVTGEAKLAAVTWAAGYWPATP